jgi:preprotein translocase SecE subunit
VQTYKEGHGVLVRRTAFAVLAGMAVWGAMTLYGALVDFKSIQDLKLVNYRIPVLNQYIDAAFFVTWIAAGLVIWWLYRALSRERAADYLIETEVEFRKVTWPTWNDAVTSALVVLLFVVVMTAYIALCDFSLTSLLGWVL